MALPIDIATIISYGNICSYLAANDFAKQRLLKSRSFQTKLPQKLDIATNLVTWAYGQNPNDTSLISTGNYLYQLCGKYIAEAQLVISGAGTGSIVNPATGVVSTILAVYLEFIVGVTSSPVLVNGVNVTLPINGETSFVLPLANILDGSIGVAKDTVPLPTLLTDRYSFTPMYTPSSVTININNGNAFTNGDLFVITGLQYVSI
jgi:hypothetical protein